MEVIYSNEYLFGRVDMRIPFGNDGVSLLQ